MAPSALRWAVIASSAALFGVAVAVLLVIVPLVIVPRYPLTSLPLSVVLGTVVGLADVALVALVLRHRDSARHQQWALWLTEGIGWTLTAGILAVFAHYPDSKALSAMVFPLVAAGASLRWVGFARAVIVEAGLLGTLLVAQWRVLALIGGEEALRLAIDWGVLLLVVAAISGTLPRFAQYWHQQEMARRAGHMAAQAASREAGLRHLEVGLSKRERELLPLLADRELTYAEIARRVSGKKITAATVKVHVRNISRKLELDGADRERVVATVRERGLMPPVEPGDEPPEITADLPTPSDLATAQAGRTSAASEPPQRPAPARRSA
jgi:DNA-binding CsgD family transcriptional regulator